MPFDCYIFIRGGNMEYTGAYLKGEDLSHDTTLKDYKQLYIHMRNTRNLNGPMHEQIIKK